MKSSNAINWFEIILPSQDEDFLIAYEKDHPPNTDGETIKSRTIEHTTWLCRFEGLIYHVTTNPLPGIETKRIKLSEYPTLLKISVENGFAHNLQENGFRVHKKHLGGIAFKSDLSSIKPDIYGTQIGCNYRAFYGFGRRIGLILNYRTGQFFSIGLDDQRLADFALYKRVIHRYDNAKIDIRSGILQQTDKESGTGTITDSEGIQHPIKLSDWTLACRKDILLSFLREYDSETVARDVSKQLSVHSLSLTNDNRMNTALAKDQQDKLLRLVEQNNLSLFTLPLNEKPLVKMSLQPLLVNEGEINFPHIAPSKTPNYNFSDTVSNHISRDKHRGLIQYGPLKEANVRKPSCLFIFADHDRDNANKLYLALRNGIGTFPGCKQLLGIELEKDQVQALRVSNVGKEKIAHELYTKVDQHLSGNQIKPDFAFVIYSRNIPDYLDNPYDAAKAALTKHGIPSQFVSWEVLQSDNTFKWSITNIALGFFVKLGGKPWSIAIEKKAPTLILGIGSAELPDATSVSARRFLGYAVCTLSNGLYIDTSFFPPAERYTEFLDKLKKGLASALERLLEDYETVEKVTIHVSQFEKKQTLDVIQKVIKEFEKSQKLLIPFELVRLTEDSDFNVTDPSDPKLVSKEGTRIILDKFHALLVTEGRTEKAVWRGRKPLTLEIHQEFTSSPSIILSDSIDDIYSLSMVNWRALNCLTQPISLKYASLLTKLVAKMAQFEPNICNYLEQHKELSKVPWFL